MEYEKYNFDDPNLDYGIVADTVYKMYSDLLARAKCCASHRDEEALTKSARFITGMEVNTRIGNTVRYKEDVRFAYETLYNVLV